ncbi:PIN domain-containing protein [Gaoshiqia sediminis]|uniref:PIN domain-containing protein n=1 Tax=Gaoshiqia sediminis TaxID=2986998 RepID=A0AA41Y9P5_9BACT|nr:PIN domain-containing protein [Gaoshiqia sediminis]MCW0484749.1 PIN domain-containing protein [Gaoshiqia sediminis]
MKSTEIIDANFILRYLLQDQEQHFVQSKEVLENHEVFIPFEVCAEVVYVLEKVYQAPRTKIHQALDLLMAYPNVATIDKPVIRTALEVYRDRKIDFVDCMLIAYHRENGAVIHSFDKKINQLCQ